MLLGCCAVIFSKLRPSPHGDAFPAAARLLLQPEGVAAEPSPARGTAVRSHRRGRRRGGAESFSRPLHLWAASGGLSGTLCALGREPLVSLDHGALLRSEEAAGWVCERPPSGGCLSAARKVTAEHWQME